MLAAMAVREFLGWDRPFVERAVAWLLVRRSELPEMLVVVPTAASGRRLREALASAAGGLLSPRITTPGALMETADADSAAAPGWLEQLAWAEVLETITDWTPYEAVFPAPPGEGANWAMELAGELAQLRRSLQDNGLTLASAARRLAASVEAERWQALAALEDAVERQLHIWGWRSRSRQLAGGIALAGLPPQIVLAGVTELPPLVERCLLARDGTLTILIAAPESEADGFAESGRPLACWNQRSLPWPEGSNGSVRVVADPRQQAREAMACLTAAGSASDQVALGTADDEVGGELVTVLAEAGWPAFHPAATAADGGWRGFLACWRRWLEEPSCAVMADLLGYPQTDSLLGGGREWLALRLAGLRGEWMIQQPADLARRLAGARFRSAADRASAEAVLDASAALENWRQRFAGEGFAAAMGALVEHVLAATPPQPEAGLATAGWLLEWLAEAAPLVGRVRRTPAFWLDLMLAAVPVPSASPPAERVIDVQGWLEMLYEPGSHLVLCGINDGRVPARGGGDPWLGEAARKALGLADEAARAARDAYLYQAMLAPRLAAGRVDVICGKAGAGGDLLQPSRLLLAGPREQLPQRVAVLFREVEPPEAGLRWQADWQWQPRVLESPTRISVTALRDYLACPLRYYLKHLAGMAEPETARLEWNARDFGTVAHAVLEKWGQDTEAREYNKIEALEAWFSAALEREIAGWFGRRVPLAVRIQAAALRRRLAWLARVQACERAAGWQVVDVERKVEIAFGSTTVVAKIDRIDRHEGSGAYRVIDYKTGRVERGVAAEHRSRITTATRLPPHLAADSAAVFSLTEKGKELRHRWTNLQLPLYALALVHRDLPLPQPCYLTLGSSEDRVKLLAWEDFSEAEMSAAEACAGLLVTMIGDRVFGPPAERVSYDDFRDLAAGRTLAEVMAPVGPEITERTRS